MKPKTPKPQAPPQPVPTNEGIMEDKVIDDPVETRRKNRDGLRRSFLTAPASAPGVGVNV